MSDKGFYFRLPDRQLGELRDLSVQTDLKISEIMQQPIAGIKMDEVIKEIFGIVGYRDGKRFIDFTGYRNQSRKILWFRWYFKNPFR